MPLTVDRLDPAIIAAIRADCERVVAKTDQGYRLGVRGRGLYMMFNCLGRITLTDDGEVYHSMVGSVPVYNAVELNDAHSNAEHEECVLRNALQDLKQASCV